MKKIKSALIILIILFSFNVPQAASDKSHTEGLEEKATGHQSPVTSEPGENAGHGSQAESGGADSEEHNAGIPLVYYLNWIGLALMFVIVLGEIKKNKKDKKQDEIKKDHEFYEAGSEKPDDPEHKLQKPILKPCIIIIMAVLIFFGEQVSALFGHVDVEKAKLIAGFHENLAAGYFRFIFKILIGILMLIYGLSSVEEEHH